MSRRADRKRAGKALAVTPALLRGWPLSNPDSDSDKDERGAVLVAGGSRQVPGGLILAGVASLRAGAGKLQLAAPASIAISVGAMVVEASVVPLSESREGSLDKAAGRELRKLDQKTNAVLVGPGMMDPQLASSFLAAYLGEAPKYPLVIDAACLGNLSMSKKLGSNVVLTPHAGEMAAMLRITKERVQAAPALCALEASRKLGCVVVMKGSETFIATPDDLFIYDRGDVGLATSGSGDVLSGVIAGLLARGAPTDQAAVWGVAIHGAAGNALKRDVGEIGFLARELLDEIPRAMLKGVLR